MISYMWHATLALRAQWHAKAALYSVMNCRIFMYTVVMKGMSADNVLALGVVSDFAGSGVAGAPGFSELPGSPGALPSVPAKCRSHGAFPPEFQREAGI